MRAEPLEIWLRAWSPITRKSLITSPPSAIAHARVGQALGLPELNNWTCVRPEVGTVMHATGEAFVPTVDNSVPERQVARLSGH